MSVKHILIALVLFMTMKGIAQDPLSRTITLHTGTVTLEKGLDQMSKAGNFSFSYNADILPLDSPVSIEVEQKKVRTVLSHTIQRPSIQFKEYDNYVIIFQKDPPRASQSPSSYRITGYIRNARTGEVIPYASIYERGTAKSTLTNDNGQYALTVSADDPYVGLSVSKQRYLDTVVIVQPERHEEINISLQPATTGGALSSYQTDQIGQQKERVEEIGVVNFFVPVQAQYHASNIRQGEQRWAQVSFLPFLGSNGLRSGSFSNRFSLNILAGYNRGTEGVELGGLLNIDREDMAGVQLAALGNVVGGKTYGLQSAGFFNTALNSVYGLQIAGFANYAQQTFYGIQLAGFNNMLVGDMNGVQISGFNNLATHKFDGVQLAGFSNFAIDGMSRFQGAGFFNYARQAHIAQTSGFANVAINKVSGIQAAGFGNYTHHLNGLQASGFANIASGTVNGVQAAGFLNYGTTVNGVQLGFINIADSVNGVPFGFFSYVLDGYHHLQLSGDNNAHFQARFKTGVDHFYNIFSAGIYAGPEAPLWSYGYGFGTAHTFFDKVELSLDVTGHTLLPFSSVQRLDNFLGQVNLQAAWRFKEYLSIFAGPSYNIFHSGSASADTSPAILNYPKGSAKDQSIWGNDVKTWIGLKAGIRF